MKKTKRVKKKISETPKEVTKKVLKKKRPDMIPNTEIPEGFSKMPATGPIPLMVFTYSGWKKHMALFKERSPKNFREQRSEMEAKLRRLK